MTFHTYFRDTIVARSLGCRVPVGRMTAVSTRRDRGKSDLHRTRWWVTPTAPTGDRRRRESATESIPPFARRGVRVKRCGKSAPTSVATSTSGKPHREKDRAGGMRRSVSPDLRVGRSRFRATGIPEKWSSPLGVQKSAYRPTGTGRWKSVPRRGEFTRQEDAVAFEQRPLDLLQ